MVEYFLTEKAIEESLQDDARAVHNNLSFDHQITSASITN
jgi:hypothetical protein